VLRTFCASKEVLGDPIDCRLIFERRLDRHISVARLKLRLRESKRKGVNASCVLQSCESSKQRVLQASQGSSVRFMSKCIFEVDEAKRYKRKGRIALAG